MPESRRFIGHPNLRHGTVKGYAAGCRCRRCDGTAREYARARHLDHFDGGDRAATILRRRPPRPTGFRSGVGSARRLRALVTIGYAPNYLALRLSVMTAEVMDCLFLERRGTIQKWKAQNIAALYDELWDQPQTGTIADQARIVARREGWHPPMSWDDDEIDDIAAKPFGTAEPDETDPTFLPFTELEYLFYSGASLEEILRRGGYASVDSLKKRLYNHGRRDLVAKIPPYPRTYSSKRAGIPA